MVAAVNAFVGRSNHLSCFAYSLNLIVESVYKLESFCALCEKVRNIVKFFKNSVVYSDKLRSSQNCNPPLKPILDVRTRWNSLYYMLDRYVQLAPTIHQILVLDSKAPPIPTAQELETITTILEVLKLFEIATKEISGEQFVKVSKVIPIVKTLRAQMRNEMVKNGSNNDIVNKVKMVLNDQLTIRFKNIEENHIHALSCVLDPRFKNIAFSDPCAYARCLSWLRDMQSHEEVSEAQKDSDVEVVESPEKNDFWNHIRTLASGREGGRATQQRESISEYIHCKLLPVNADPLYFWKENKVKYPFLSKTALRYLVIPATSVPSERLVSKAGFTLAKTSRLAGKRLDKLLFLADCTEEEWGFLRGFFAFNMFTDIQLIF
ncbi:PREDICTED: zinc finger BED domain-containing protein 4-like [Rhagoletis zephyria]|uniref:zinc finger BED domain-containing protein 4-like n=1 Tax=Rhagoletis zephyria TaxID=28612 RepID=UPI000811721C|nr:PREDICTED: zinc finger BED domain-containing protein 4-like [Rhagoletis zephyria]